jgi:hypothetical protein
VPEVVDAVGGRRAGARRRRHRHRPAGRRGAGARRAGRVDGLGVWLGTEEYQHLQHRQGWDDGALARDVLDTVRTRVYTGKPARLLKTRWTEAWAEEDAPEPLPMPLQNLLVAEAHNRINASATPTSSRCRSARSSAG